MIDPELYDRQEAHGEARAFIGEPDASQDEFWAGVLEAPAYIPPEKEVEF